VNSEYFIIILMSCYCVHWYSHSKLQI